MDNRPHTHVFTDTVVPATCRESGYTLHRCDCGYAYKDNFIRTGDHSFGLAQQTDATCLENGSRTLRCTVCGLEKAETLPATGHRWSDWSVQRVATCLEDGMETRICSCCGLAEERMLKATGHKLTQPRKSETKKGVTEYICKNCGQIVEKESVLHKSKKAILIVAIAAALAILAFVIIPALAPFAHYGLGRLLIPMGAYSAAYWNLQNAEELFDTEDLLEDFIVLNGFSKEYFVSDGEKTETSSTYYTYDEQGNITSRTGAYLRGTTTSTFTNEYDEQGYLIRTTCYNEDGEVKDQYEYVYEFDEQGQKISQTIYDTDGNIHQLYKYDGKGNEVCYIYFNDDGSINTQYDFEYDADGNKRSETRYNGTEIDYHHDYDKDGNEIYEIIYSGGIPLTIYEREYDKKGNLIAYIHYDGDKRIQCYREYALDLFGNPVKVINYTDSGEIDSYTEYKYDLHGNRTKAIVYEPDVILSGSGEVVAEDFIRSGWTTYKYDQNGNCTRETDYDANGSKQYVKKRKYDSAGNLKYVNTVRYKTDSFFNRFKPDSQVIREYGDFRVFYKPAIK